MPQTNRRGEAARADLVAIAALSVHLGAALFLRTIAWPEVTTPAYLWSRGMLMYRDIKFVHTPGTIGLLALAFAVFGVSTWVVRAFALAWPLAAHGMLLKETRAGFSAGERLVASFFFLAALFAWQGTSVWPTTVMTALAIPIARALGARRILATGLWIGVAILLKQTAAYLLLVVVLRLLFQRRARDAAAVAGLASAPYLLAAAGFALAGAGRDFFLWTLVAPLRIRQVIEVPVSGATLYLSLCAFLPLALEAALEKRGEYETGGRDLLVVALGFALIAFPRFSFLQMLGSVPLLAVGVARLLRRGRGLFRVFAYGIVLAFAVSLTAIVAAGEPMTGKVLFWNDSPAFEKLVADLRRLPRSTRLSSELWENVLPRTGLLPPGGIYVNPLLAKLYGLGEIDGVAERVRDAASLPGVVRLDYGSAGFRKGPYVVSVNR